ncbi:MAG: amidohydrolase family protein [Chthonomonadales bacterium]|nr:amidohydrolase family protein [Chthonomonadales bacterium]
MVLDTAYRGVPGEIRDAVQQTPFVDTHEHLVEEERRTRWEPSPLVPSSDWALLLSHYIDSDLLVAGMPPEHRARLLADGPSPREKWDLVAPWWPSVRGTGYGLCVRAAVRRLYGIDDLSADTVDELAQRFREAVRPGYYERVLREAARIESCQVNSLESTFVRSRQPSLLMQDVSILNLGDPGQWRAHAEAADIAVRDLCDYHRVLDWWFETCGRYAVAVKSQAAYGRRLDFADVPAERVAGAFARVVDGLPLGADEGKALEDHLFCECVRRATAIDLPVKLHTGYYAGQNGMPLERVRHNPSDAAELMRRSPDTRWVLMHIGYPYQDEMIALAKHWSGAYIDMCWAWIINPAAGARFLRELLVCAPANKVLTFGGDFIPVELVAGHAEVARHGLAGALGGLVADGYLSLSDALDLVEPLMRGNARALFRLDAKERALAVAPWAT